MFYRLCVVVLALILVLGASAAPVTSAEAVSSTAATTHNEAAYGAKFEYVWQHVRRDTRC